MDRRFEVTIKGGTICVDKVLPSRAQVMIPPFIEGLPVSELGSYALSGSKAEEVYLPPYLQRIGAYAFYGCEDLRAIHAYGRALDLGAGVFAGDKKIDLLDIIEFPGETSCLKEMLSEIRNTLNVRLRELKTGTPDFSGEETGPDETMFAAGSEARLVFPEYFEESIENTPARQLVYEMHGCGQRYRYSFVNREFKFEEYDSLFPYAVNETDEATAAELAIGRLRFPRELSDEARKTYEEYLRQNWKAAAEVLIGADKCESVTTTNLEPEILPWLLEDILKPDEEMLSCITDLAQRQNDTAMVSYCMDFRRKSRLKGGEDKPGGKDRPKKRRFELT